MSHTKKETMKLKYKDINFIGIEKYDSVIAKGLQKIPEGLNNLVMIRADALDIDNIFSKDDKDPLSKSLFD